MEGREPAPLSTKCLSAASSGDALSASAWGSYSLLIPVSPAGIRGSAPLWPPCVVFFARSESQPHSIWGNVQGSEPLALPAQTAALLSGTEPDHSSFYLGVKGVQHTVSQF